MTTSSSVHSYGMSSVSANDQDHELDDAGIGMVRDIQAHTSARTRQTCMPDMNGQAQTSEPNRQARMSDIVAPRFAGTHA